MEGSISSNSSSINFAGLGIKQTNNATRTVFGKTRTLGSLSSAEKIFLATAILSLLAVVGLAVTRIVLYSQNPSNPVTPGSSSTMNSVVSTKKNDFVLALVILVSAVFCSYYVLIGIFQERPYELIMFSIAVMTVLVYSIFNYTIKTTSPTDLLVRLVVISFVGPFLIVFGLFYARSYYISGALIFRTVGASVELQRSARIMFASLSAAVLDFQLALSMVIFIVGGLFTSTLELSLVLSLGVTFSILWLVLLFASLVMESRKLCYIVLATSVLEPAYVIYRIYRSVIALINVSGITMLPFEVFLTGLFGLLTRGLLIMLIVISLKQFGRGLKNTGLFFFKTSSPKVPQDYRSAEEP